MRNTLVFLMQKHIDHRSSESTEKSYTLETTDGMFSFNGKIQTSSPNLDRYIAMIDGSKTLLRYHKNEKTLEIVMMD